MPNISESKEIKTDTKTCPYCKELVNKNAVVCKHCRKNISTSSMVSKGLFSLGCILMLLPIVIIFIVILVAVIF